MQCNYCNNKATVFFTQIIGEKVQKTALCEECATAQGVTDPEGFLLGGTKLPDPPSSAPSKIDVPMESSPKAESIQLPTSPLDLASACPTCGFAFDDLKKTGRIGCSECYSFFRSAIKANLKGMHKGTRHTGRIPEGMLEAFQRQQYLEKLQLEMDEAIEAENYEKAASLRDKIKHLNQKTPATTKPS